VDLLQHSFFGVFLAAEKHLVIKDEQFRFGFSREFRQLFGGSVKVRDVLAPLLLALLVTALSVNFVEKNVAAVAILDDALARRAIA